jgi:hypothetical protein
MPRFSRIWVVSETTELAIKMPAAVEVGATMVDPCGTFKLRENRPDSLIPGSEIT